jgi:hypothetical protein
LPRPFFIGHFVEHRVGFIELLILFGRRRWRPLLAASGHA